MNVLHEWPSGKTTRPVRAVPLMVPLTVPVAWIHPKGQAKLPVTDVPDWVSVNEILAVAPDTEERTVPCHVPVTSELFGCCGVGCVGELEPPQAFATSAIANAHAGMGTRRD